MIPVVVSVLLLQAVPAPAPTPVPFSVGETFEYTGRYGPFTPAHAVMKVAGIETLRGVPVWHFTLSFNVSFALWHNHSELESWTGVGDFFSRRFDKNDDGKITNATIFPDSEYYRINADTTKRASPPDPIDDVAFMYYLRTAHFAEHRTDTIQRYYRKDRNPVIIEVLGREMVDTGDGGRFYCWILHPIVEEPNGMFSTSHDARVWITDDGRRLPVQIRSKYPVIGNLTLRLSKYTRGS